MGIEEREIIWRTYGVTDITPYSMAIIIIVGILIFFLPRRYVLPAMFWPVFFIPEFQRIVVADLDFNVMRIFVIFGWLRLMLDSEKLPSLQLNAIDVTIILWVISSIFAYWFLRGSLAALTYQIGEAFQTLGLYFMFRLFIRDFSDLRPMFKGLAIVCVGIALAMTIELIMEKNFLAFLGAKEPQWREGRLRCTGPFDHPILAGTFGASLLPIFVALWWQKEKAAILSVLGIVAGIIIAITSASSGPVMTLAFGMIGLGVWPLRRHLRLLRWTMALGLVALAMVMKDPIWYIITKFSLVGGSTAYHRTRLIDAAITHFNEWRALGTISTAHWGWGLQDVTNQFILEGVEGGIITLLLFILIIIFCFQTIGRLLPLIEKQPVAVKMIFWAMGASLLSHMASFGGASYFDQILFWWLLLLAFISGARDIYKKMTFTKTQGQTNGSLDFNRQLEFRRLRQSLLGEHLSKH